MEKEISLPSLPTTGIATNECQVALVPVRDALYVLSGKWKLPIIIAMVKGNTRFGSIKKAVENISPKVLSQELKELELNGFLTRTVYDTYPVTTGYQLTPYSTSLGPVLVELEKWGLMHREKIMKQVDAP